MQNNKSNRILIELGIFTLLFGLAFLLPFEFHYYLSSDETNIRTVALYYPDFPFANLIIITFLTVLVSILSGSKKIIQTINIIVLILMSLGFLLLIYAAGVGWGASPIHPELGPAYGFTQMLILVLIIRSYLLLRKFDDFTFNKNLSRISGILAIGLPVVSIIYASYSLYSPTNEPIMRSEFELTNEKGMPYRMEAWDYMNSHDAFVNKFFSEKKLTDGTIEKYLDSVEFSLHAPELPTIKKFTRKSIEGELDIEEILDNEQPE